MKRKKTVLVYEKAHEEVLQDLLSVTEQLWQAKGYDILRLPVSSQRRNYEYVEELQRMDAEYLLSFAMAGFGWKTLTSQVSYNLLYAKQMHILIGDYGDYEKFLQKEYAINLFFFADNKKWTENWEERYPGIPFMERIPQLYIGKNLSALEKQEDNRIMQQIMDTVHSIVEGS